MPAESRAPVAVCHVVIGTPAAAGDAPALDPAERDRAFAYRREADRRRFLAGRTLARRLVASLAECDPAAVRIATRCVHCGATEHGKPYAVADGRRRPLSIAHSDERVVVAVTDGPEVGVDVERLAPERFGPGVVRMVEGPGEVGTVGDVDGFIRLWVHKEAVLKCTGEGLMTPPSALSLDFSGAVPRIAACDDGALPEIALRTLDVSGPFCGALAVASPEPIAVEVACV